MAELRKDSLTFIEAIGQSICSLSPTFTPALGVAVVGGMGGLGLVAGLHARDHRHQ